MDKKEYFSGHASVYAAFRPTYPAALYEFIFGHLHSRERAWDCATGNGQVARALAPHFKQVLATDISQQQLDNAHTEVNIVYSKSGAEKTEFPDNTFDLITVGQALHWFDLNAFYSEVGRTARPGALLAVWGYAILSVTPDIDQHFLHFYNNVVGPYWDEARKLVEEEYKHIPFPFEEIAAPPFQLTVSWNRDQSNFMVGNAKVYKSKQLQPCRSPDTRACTAMETT
jgi:SAM-dependent methyltransferase